MNGFGSNGQASELVDIIIDCLTFLYLHVCNFSPFPSVTQADGNEKMKEFMQKNYKPSATYQEFAPQFTAEFYDPEHWAKLFQKSGAR